MRLSSLKKLTNIILLFQRRNFDKYIIMYLTFGNTNIIIVTIFGLRQLHNYAGTSF